MDFPEAPGGNGTGGDDGPGRPPRKTVDRSGNDAENQQDGIEAFGDANELPAWVFLFFAALLAEYFRSLNVCEC